MNSAEVGTAYPPGQPCNSDVEFYKFYNSRSLGLMLTFPFLRKWECELGSDVVITKDWRQYTIWNRIQNTAPPEYSTTFISRWNSTTSVRLRSVFSYEILHKGKFDWQAAAGTWYDLRGAAGFVGVEGGVKLNYTPVKSGAMQLSATYGATKGGQYVSLRLRFALCGTRTYRVKPDKYYVRTYEED